MDKSAKTPELEATPDPLGTESLWRTPDRHTDQRQKLPNYIEHIADALRRGGMDESQAIATAINSVKRWANGSGHVRPEVRAAARRAVAEWERLKETHKP